MTIGEKQAKSASGLLGLTTNLSFIDQALVSGGNFVAGILMARAFGLYEFGRFTLVWMVVEFLWRALPGDSHNAPRVTL